MKGDILVEGEIEMNPRGYPEGHKCCVAIHWSVYIHGLALTFNI